jgi:hypothetical protein
MIMKATSRIFRDFFTVNVYYGMKANLERGKLGLVKATTVTSGDYGPLVVGSTSPVQEEVVV